MANRLVDHLRERGRIAGAGFAARWLRPLPAGRWRQAVVLLKTQPVGKITLALAAAFACGVVLGVGVAAFVAPRHADALRTIAAAGAQGAAAQKKAAERAAYAVPVRVREEGTKPAAPAAVEPLQSAPGPVAPQNTATPPAASAQADAAAPAMPTPTPSAAPETAPVQAENEAPARVQVPLASVVAAPAPVPLPKDVAVAEPASAAEAPRLAAPPPVDAIAAVPAPIADALSVAHTDTAPITNSAARPVPAVGQQIALMPPSLRDPEVHSPGEGAQTPDRPVMQQPPSGTPSPELAALPVPRGDAAWIRNAVKLPDVPRSVAIAIIIDDMGIDQKRSKLALELPAPLTFSFIPYGYHLHDLVAAARAAGQEVMLHVPMEPLDPEVDPGPNALRTTVSVEENRRRLLWDFSRLEGFVGLNNHMGSKFTAWKPGMEMVMKEVRAHGLLFVNSFTSNNSVGLHLARAHRLPSAARDIFIDHDITTAAIEHSLKELEQLARRRGFAVGIAHPHDLSREILARWIPEAKARGVSFVPISYIVRREMKSG